MKTLRPTLLALSLLAAYPAAQAQATNQQILDELRALRERVGQLEAQLESVKAKTPAKRARSEGPRPSPTASGCSPSAAPCAPTATASPTT